jgi:hypothetical protein
LTEDSPPEAALPSNDRSWDEKVSASLMSAPV